MISTPNGAEPARPRRAPARKNTTARKTATASANGAGNMTASDVAAFTVKQAFNLDALERESSKEPFAFIHLGREYMLEDPQEKDWQQLVLVVSDPIRFLRLVLRPADVDAFFENAMPTWKLRALTEAYRDHFGLGELGESGGLSV